MLAKKAIEAIGTIDHQNRIVLDESLPIAESTRVRIIILMPYDTDIDEMDWLKSASVNPVFDFLKDDKEDIYTLEDGRAFHDQR